MYAMNGLVLLAYKLIFFFKKKKNIYFAVHICAFACTYLYICMHPYVYSVFLYFAVHACLFLHTSAPVCRKVLSVPVCSTQWLSYACTVYVLLCVHTTL